MALESATYIDDLNVSNPAASDAVGQADDHLRMLKAVLKNTFPNIDSPVTSTPLQLNQGVVPIGLIAMWSGSTSSLPTNWRLCDGGTYAKSDGSGNITVPDLRGRFIKGCGGSTGSPSAAPTVSTTGGSATHTHTSTVSGSALSQAQLPNCSFVVTDGGHTHSVTDPGHQHNLGDAGSFAGPGFATVWRNGGSAEKSASATTGISIVSNTTGISVSSGGSGLTHDHTATVSTDNGEPPYYVLAFIIKI